MHKVMGLFRDEESAKRAVEAIKEKGVSEDRISFVVKHDEDAHMEAGAEIADETNYDLGVEQGKRGMAGASRDDDDTEVGRDITEIDIPERELTVNDANNAEADTEAGRDITEVEPEELTVNNENRAEADTVAGRNVIGLEEEEEDLTVDNLNTANTDMEAGKMEATQTKQTDGVGDGVATGGALGGIAGILAGAGMLAIPGVGPILAAGPLASGLSGLAAGGIAGGLVDYGIDEETGQRYANEIESGRILVAIEEDDDTRINKIAAMLEERGAYNIERQ